MISVPAGVTSVEKRAVRDAALKAGAREAYLIEEPLAAAIGANVPISGPSGNLVIDIGGGTSEIAVIALGGIVVSHLASGWAATASTRRSPRYIRKKYNLMIGERTAEEVKIADRDRAAARARAPDGGPRPRPHRRPAADDPDHQLGGDGGDRAAAPAARRGRPVASWSRRPPELSSRHHRQGHGHVRRRRAPAEHRQAPDPGDRASPATSRRTPSTAWRWGPASPWSTSTSSRSPSSSRSRPDRDGAPAPARVAPSSTSTATRRRASTRCADPAAVVRAAAAARPDPPRDHGPRPDRRRPARPATRAPAGLTVIVGEEVKTADGDLICLFLTRAIPPGLLARGDDRGGPRAGRPGGDPAPVRPLPGLAAGGRGAARGARRRSWTGWRSTTPGSWSATGNAAGGRVRARRPACPGSPSPTPTRSWRSGSRRPGLTGRPVARRTGLRAALATGRDRPGRALVLRARSSRPLAKADPASRPRATGASRRPRPLPAGGDPMSDPRDGAAAGEARAPIREREVTADQVSLGRRLRQPRTILSILVPLVIIVVFVCAQPATSSAGSPT